MWSNRTDAARPATRWPPSASRFACRPLPHPRSATRLRGGRVCANSTISGHAVLLVRSNSSAISSNVRATSPRVGRAAGTGSRRASCELGKDVLPDLVRARQFRGGLPLRQVLHEGGRHLPAARRALRGPDLEGPALPAPEGLLPPAELPALRGGLPLPLHDVHREVHGRRVRQGRADAQSVRNRLGEGGDRGLVESAAHIDLRVLVTPAVELP